MWGWRANTVWLPKRLLSVCLEKGRTTPQTTPCVCLGYRGRGVGGDSGVEACLQPAPLPTPGNNTTTITSIIITTTTSSSTSSPPSPPQQQQQEHQYQQQRTAVIHQLTLASPALTKHGTGHGSLGDLT